MRSQCGKAICLLVAAALLACSEERLRVQEGRLEVWDDQTASFSATAILDFGEHVVGRVAERRVRLRNSGDRTIALAAPVVVSGSVAASDAEAGTYLLSYRRGLEIAEGDEIELSVGFRPTEVSEAGGEHAEVKLSADGAEQGAREVSLVLRGHAVADPCEFPETLDFGRVFVGQSKSATLEVRNPFSQSAMVELACGSGDSPFVCVPEAAFELPGKSTSAVRIVFQPSIPANSADVVRMSGIRGCGEVTIFLLGQGIDRLIATSPEQIDCGAVALGSNRVRPLAFTNVSEKAVAVRDPRLVGPEANDFGFAGSDWSPPAFVLGPSETTMREIRCEPSSFGEKSATLELEIDSSLQPSVEVPLYAVGAGPDIVVEPLELDFGLVAVSAHGELAEERSFSIGNQGSAPEAELSVGALRLGALSPDGSYGPPYFQVLPSNSGTRADELEGGLEGDSRLMPGGRVVVGVRMLAKTAGEKAAVFEVLSNDPDEPRKRVSIRAEARSYPPCEYLISPLDLDLGVAHARMPRTHAFTFENRGTRPEQKCLVSGMRLTAESLPDYRLADVAVPREVGPGEKLTVEVTLQPSMVGTRTFGELTGAVELRASNPARPHAFVSLRGGTGAACLVPWPNALDFGGVPPGSRSPSQPLKLLHLCEAEVRLLGARLEGPNGDEFELEVSRAIPPGGLPLIRDIHSSMDDDPPEETARLRFAPLSEGDKLAVISLEVEQAGELVRHVIPIRGTADDSGVGRLELTQGGGKKVDVVIVMQNHESMERIIGPTVAQHASTLLDSLAMAEMDYHIGVLPHGYSGDIKAGMFTSGPDDPDRFITPSSARRAEQLALKIARGYSGGSNPFTEHDAWSAVVPPHRDGWNAGFLRADADLAIVLVETKSDMAYHPLSWPWYDLIEDVLDVDDLGDMMKAFMAIDGPERPYPVRWVQMVEMLNYPPAPCSAHLPSAEWNTWLLLGAPRAAVSLLGGRVIDSCEDAAVSWERRLEYLDDAISGMTRNFRLPAEADLSRGAIEVSVDGAVLLQADANGVVWEYDEVNREVHFELARAPRPGQKVLIRYPTRLEP